MHTWFTSPPNYNRKWTELSLFQIIVNTDVLSITPWWNISMKFIRITFFFIQDNAFENAVYAILCVHQYVNVPCCTFTQATVGLNLVTSILTAAVRPGALDFEMEKNSRKLIFFQDSCLKVPKPMILYHSLWKLFCNSRWRPAILDLWNS